MESVDQEWANFMSSQNGGMMSYAITKPVVANNTAKAKINNTTTNKTNTNNAKIIIRKTNKTTMCKNTEEPIQETNSKKGTINLRKKKPVKKEETESESESESETEEDSDESININSIEKETNNSIEDEDVDEIASDTAPECGELYISTKTKVIYLNKPVAIENIFWQIPIVDYWKPANGVIKKQMKIVCVTPEEVDKYIEKRDSLTNYYAENIIKQINNTSATRIKYKDERKITIGLSKKDIMNCRSKKKGAFYNCFALIIRVLFEDSYKEIHVKVFNTGKMEIPGVLNMKLLTKIKEMVLDIIQPFVNDKLDFIETNIDKNVLINSNFKCGFSINRKKLYSILLQKYRILSSFDPSIYPGLKCKFYFNNELGFDSEKQNGRITDEDKDLTVTDISDKSKYKEVTFVAFQTGSCLIVGGCSENILMYVFEFFKKILQEEYQNIFVSSKNLVIKNKKKKLRKRVINITNDYYKVVMKNYVPNSKYCIEI